MSASAIKNFAAGFCIGLAAVGPSLAAYYSGKISSASEKAAAAFAEKADLEKKIAEAEHESAVVHNNYNERLRDELVLADVRLKQLQDRASASTASNPSRSNLESITSSEDNNTRRTNPRASSRVNSQSDPISIEQQLRSLDIHVISNEYVVNGNANISLKQFYLHRIVDDPDNLKRPDDYQIVKESDTYRLGERVIISYSLIGLTEFIENNGLYTYRWKRVHQLYHYETQKDYSHAVSTERINTITKTGYKKREHNERIIFGTSNLPTGRYRLTIIIKDLNEPNKMYLSYTSFSLIKKQ